MIKNKLSPSNRSGALDLLRFLAVVVVFFAHYTDTFNYVYHIVPENFKYIPVFKYGPTALLVFFTVSGYVVTMTSMKRNLKDFVITRLSRLYPLFWISCVAAFILPRLFYSNHSYLPDTSVKTFLYNLTMLPSAFGYQLINPVYHTLALEILFYIFIALIIVFKLWDKILIIIGIMLLLCIANLFKQDVPVYIIVNPFLAGMIFYLISIQYASKIKLFSLLAVNFFCSVSSSWYLAEQLDLAQKGEIVHHASVIISIITVIYLVFLLISIKVIRISGRPFFQLLGEIAYPFYLFHIYFLCFYWYFRNKVQADLLLFGILIIAIFTSWVINVLLEKPLSSLANRGLYYLTDLFRKEKISKVIN